jgi:FKBP-type peptidyl-prolyl cis-trans isomerase SlyD
MLPKMNRSGLVVNTRESDKPSHVTMEFIMSSPLTLNDGIVGIIHYTLLHEDGSLIESSVGGPPQPYLHGSQNLIPGLEAALTGKTKGDLVEGQLEAKDAFGEHDGNEPQRVPRNELPPDREWKVGMPLPVRASNGQVIWLWVSKIEGAGAWVTANHPLAGQTVKFEAEVVNVREAKPVETEHGHPHGLDGEQGHDH